MMKDVTALVPMKHHSQRVPGKNYRMLAGKPLYYHILATLSSVAAVEEIVVDTDSPLIKAGLSSHFPQVRVLDRPPDLQGDEVSMNRIIAHDLSQVPGEYFLQTHSTNPFLKGPTISRAVRKFFENYPDRDSLFSVTRLYTRLWSEDGQAINHDPADLIQTQDLPPVYEENSCLYLFTREGFSNRQHRIGESPVLFNIEREEAWDIDTELDFEIAAYLMGDVSGE